MLYRIAMSIVLCSLTVALHAQSSDVVRIFFDYDKFEMDSEDRKKLLDIPRNSDCKYVVTGHADSRGSKAYNQRLSFHRMEEVRHFLLENGVAEDQVERMYFGEEDPWKAGEEEEAWKMNRRVDVLCICDVQEDGGLTDGDENEKGDILELLAELDGPPTSYFISPDKEQVIYLEKGGILTFPENAFQGNFEDGAKVELRVKEYYTLEDMVLGNLNSVSDTKLLETGGMVILEAFQDNKKVDLKAGVRYSLAIPTLDKKKGMTAWYGQTTFGNLNWKPARITSNLFEAVSAVAKKKVPGRFRLALQKGFKPQRYAYWQQIIAAQKEQDEMMEEMKELQANLKLPKDGGEGFYKLELENLGPINCDRYLNSQQPLVVIRTSLKYARNLNAKLIIPADNAIMNIYIQDEMVIFPNIPIGKPCVIVAFRMKDDKVQFSTVSFSASESTIELNDWEEVETDELKAKVKTATS